MMTGPNEPTLYDLYDETSVRYWELQMQQGREPTREQLARLVEANAEQPFPSRLRALLVKAVRGELKVKRGRPARDSGQQLRLWLAKADYLQALTEALEAEKMARRADGTPRPKSPTDKPTHERVAREVVFRWRLPMDWRSFLNEIHSRK